MRKPFLLLFVILLLIALAPLQVYGFNHIQENVQNSLSFSWVRSVLAKIPALQKIITAFSIFDDPDQMQALSTTDEFRQFFLNKKVQSLLKDETFMEYVHNQNFSKILANPQVLEILDDNSLMTSFNRLAQKVYSLDLPQKKQGGSGQE